jgi:hypothetical protein
VKNRTNAHSKHVHPDGIGARERDQSETRELWRRLWQKMPLTEAFRQLFAPGTTDIRYFGTPAVGLAGRPASDLHVMTHLWRDDVVMRFDVEVFDSRNRVLASVRLETYLGHSFSWTFDERDERMFLALAFGIQLLLSRWGKTDDANTRSVSDRLTKPTEYVFVQTPAFSVSEDLFDEDAGGKPRRRPDYGSN